MGQVDGSVAVTRVQRWSIATVSAALFTPLPQVADEHLALPLARAAADPTLYPSTDLVIASGMRGPFFLYRAAGAFYARGMDVDAWWYALLLVCLTAIGIAVWMIAESLTERAALASAATALVMASNPYRGTLHWTLLPPTNMITSTLATPVVFAAIALALRGKRGPGLVLAALAFNLHPGIGLIAASAIAILMLLDRGATTGRAIVGWFALAALAALPNTLFVLRSAPANFVAGAVAPLLPFAEQFRLYAYHAFVEDHWKEQYGWFVLQLAALCHLRLALPAPLRRAVLVLVGWMVVLMLGYALNLYTISYTALVLTFLFRASVFVKPLVWAALTGAVWRWRDGSLTRSAAVAIVIVAALHKNLDLGEGLAAVAFGAVLWADPPRGAWRAVPVMLIGVGTVQVLGQGWGVLHIAPFDAHTVDAVRAVMIGVAVLALAYGVRHPYRGAIAEPSRATGGVGRAVGVCAALLLATLVLRGNPARMRPASFAAIAAARQLDVAPATTAGVTAWAATQSPRGSLFALPPLDDRFDAFRLATGRGVYALAGDVNQLAYDASVYGDAHRRLLALGMQVYGRHDFDASGYERADSARVAAWSADGATHTVRPRSAAALPFPIAYQDSLWTVYALRSAR
jgi:hypothetical protein